MVYLAWSTFKLNVVQKGGLRVVTKDEFYSLVYGEFESSIMRDGSQSADCTDFETNYLSSANKTVTPQISPFDAKTDGVKKLYSRSTGKPFAVAIGANTCEFTIAYAVCKITGIELINAEVGDYCDFYVVHPTYGVLGQFAYTNYIAKDFYDRSSKYDADLLSGLILRMVYTSVSAKTIYINYLLHEVI